MLRTLACLKCTGEGVVLLRATLFAHAGLNAIPIGSENKCGVVAVRAAAARTSSAALSQGKCAAPG